MTGMMTENNRTGKDVERVVVTSFKAIFQHLPGNIEENHENHQSRYPVSWPILKSGI